MVRNDNDALPYSPADYYVTNICFLFDEVFSILGFPVFSAEHLILEIQKKMGTCINFANKNKKWNYSDLCSIFFLMNRIFNDSY